jgi:hypothetical protein
LENGGVPMKKIILFTLFILFSWGFAMADEITISTDLKRVEQLTETEKAILQERIEDVRSAQRALDAVKTTIARSHKMISEDWMEWRSLVEFNGEYILFFHKSYMEE